MVFIVEADSEEEVQEVLEGLPLSGVARTNVRRLHTLEDLRSPRATLRNKKESTPSAAWPPIFGGHWRRKATKGDLTCETTVRWASPNSPSCATCACSWKRRGCEPATWPTTGGRGWRKPWGGR